MKSNKKISFEDNTVEFAITHLVPKGVLIAWVENIVKHAKERNE